MSSTSGWYSPLSATIETNGSEEKLWVVEGRDLARGFSGALFLALPLLYTLEMWVRARVMPAWDIALVVALTYLGNVGFALYDGFKPEFKRRFAWLDALTAMGLGLAASAVTLLLVGRYTLSTPPEIMVKLLLLEMVPASFGASLAINQLGARKKGKDSPRPGPQNPDLRKLLGTVLGATMFAFNVAPTIEPKLITYGATWWHTLALIAFSLLVSYVIVHLSCFVQQDAEEGGVLRGKAMETLVAYLASLAISALLLWMFGYLNANTPLPSALPWVVTLGYATTLGGAAGRLIL